MAKKAMDDLLKRRMSATQQASELQATDEAYAKLFREVPPETNVRICNLLLDKLIAFSAADIGFKPYTQAQLEAFAEQLKEEGLMERIIVRPIAGTDHYEILAGHNRAAAARLAGWTEIPAEIVDADDARAIVIATSTNLIQRQNLSIVERGKAYRALLEAKSRQGQRFDLMQHPTSGETRQRYSARALVAEFFGVTEYEIRKAVKLTYLIPELASILETAPKQLNLACADMIADYDPESQQAFIEMCRNESYPLNKAAMKYIASKCPPPSAKRQDMYEAWRETRARAEKRLAAPPKKISLDRKQFAPYLDGRSDKEIETLFLEFLVQNNAIYIVPVSLQETNDYLAEHIRQYRPMHGCKFSVGCAMDGKLVGAAIVGRCRNDSQALQIDRICTTGGRTAYGMLYGAVARAAQALGYWRIIAFLPADRPDSALRAAGWARADPVDTGRKRVSKTLRYERLLMTRCRWRR